MAVYEDRVHNLIFFVLFLISGLAGVVVHCRRARRSGRRCGEVLAGIRSGFLRTSRNLGLMPSVFGSLPPDVQFQVKRSRELHVLRATTAMSVLSTIMTLGCAINVLNNLPNRERLLSKKADFSVFFMSVLLMVLGTQPCDCLKGRGRVFCHLALMFLLALTSLPLDEATAKEYDNWRGTIWAWQLAFSIILLEVRISVFTNLLFFVAAVATLMMTSHSLIQITLEVGCLAMVVVVSALMESAVVARAIHTAETEFGRGQHAAGAALLGLVCDAIVELDQDLCVAVDNPQLLNLLLRSNSKSMLGESVARFVVEEDRKQFIEQFEPGKPPKMFHTRLRDSWGKMVSMQMYHVCYRRGAKGEYRHLLGIQEEADFTSAHAPGKDGSSGEQPAPLPPPGMNVSGGSLGGHTRSSSDGPGRNLASRPLPEREGDPSLSFEVTTGGGSPIVWRSQAFSQESYGHTRDLAGLLRDAERVQQWLAESADKVFSSESAPGPLKYGSVNLSVGSKSEAFVLWGMFPTPRAGASRAEYRVGVRLRPQQGTGSKSGYSAGKRSARSSHSSRSSNSRGRGGTAPRLQRQSLPRGALRASL